LIRATREEIETYLKRMGKHGMQTLSTLGKLQPFAQCMETEIGKVILGGLVDQHERLLEKVIDLSATDEEKIEFRVIKRMLLELSDKINQYSSRVDQIKKLSA
jgi:hypothetical protein